nr:alginate lyase [Rhizobium sp.]
MASLFTLATVAALSIGLVSPAEASGWTGLFDVEKRAETLQTDAFRDIRALCLGVAIDPAWAKLKPIRKLSTTDGYGSDTSAEDFSWAVMVLSGRALAGDAAARGQLAGLLARWAEAGAFTQTEEINDAYYALKRQLLP